MARTAHSENPVSRYLVLFTRTSLVLGRMGGIVSQAVYSLDDVRELAGSSWCQEYYTKFMSVAVLQPVVQVDGTVAQQYRASADFVRREIALHLAEQDLQNWTRKNAMETHNLVGHSMCLFSPEEIASCTDAVCQCRDAETIRIEFCRTAVASRLREHLASLPSYDNDCDLLVRLLPLTINFVFYDLFPPHSAGPECVFVRGGPGGAMQRDLQRTRLLVL